MARTQEFDPNEALDRAVALFWKKGFFDSSMDDLVKATGVSRYGIYGTFGNKREFFKASLRSYADRIVSHMQRPLRKRDASLAEIQEYFAKLLQLAGSDRGRLGCLICNTATEVAPHDEDVGRAVRAVFDEYSRVFKRALRNAQARGEIGKDRDISALAWYLTGVMQGMAVMARAGYGKERIREFVKVAMRTLR